VNAGFRPRGRRAAEIAADVEAAVASGRAAPGAMLPPVRELAAELGVAPGTVATAYRLLAERGVVEGNRRAGTRVRPRPADRPRPGPAAPPGVRDLVRGNPDPALLPDLSAAWAHVDPGRRLYGPAAVLGPLGELGRAAFAADGIDLPRITVAGGALDAIERVLQAHLRPGMRVAVEDPGYAGLLDLLDALGLGVEPVAVDDDGPLPDALATALRRGARAAILTPRAQNPMGSAITVARAAELAAVLARQPDVLIVEDDHAGPVAGAPAGSVIAAGAGSAHAVAVRSASKALGPDLRVALVAGDAETVAAVEARQAVGAGWVSHVLQELVLALLCDPATAALIDRAAAAYAARRGALVDALARLGVPAHGRSGLNVWIPVGDEAAAVAGMAARGWAVAPGTRYRIASPPGIRVTVSTLDPGEAGAVATDVLASLGAAANPRDG